MCAPFAAAPRPAQPALAGPRLVRPGIWCIPVPVPRGVVAATLVYAVETDKGPVLIDSGCDDELAWNALESGLRTCGLDVQSVYGVVLTHAHSDHHGLSGRVRERSGAWIAMHGLDARLLASTGYLGPDWPGKRASLLAYCGAPVTELAADGGPRRADLVPPDRLLADGDLVDIPGRRVTAVWTPGHTPGHLCFRLADSGLLFSGDHALPTISARAGVAEYDGAGHALGDLLASLERAAELDAGAVWPGHEFAFGPGQYRERCRELLARQSEQLRRTIRILHDGPASAWTVAGALTEGQLSDPADPPEPRELPAVARRRRLVALDVLGRLQHLQAMGTVTRQLTEGVAVFSLNLQATR